MWKWLPVVIALAVSPAFATVDACKNPDGSRVTEHGFRLEDLNQDVTLDIADASEEDRLYRFRRPLPIRVDGHPRSFWDFVPGEFFLVIGRPRQDVEALTNPEWIKLMEHYRRLRDFHLEHNIKRRLSRALLKIDWLYHMADTKTFIYEWEFVEDGGVSGIEIPRAEAWNAAKYPQMNDGMMWLMVAGLYVWNNLEFTPLAEESKREFRIPDGYWQRFPKPDQPWNLESERRRVREYLCSEPSLKYLMYRAEKQWLQHPDSKIRRVGEHELQNINDFIDKNVADFERIHALLQPGSVGRQQYLELLPTRLIAKAAYTLENQGAAKSYIALRDRTLDAVARYGGSTRASYIWEHFWPSEKYVWPDVCLRHLEYPNATVSKFSWIVAPPFEAVCDLTSPTSQEIYEKYR